MLSEDFLLLLCAGFSRAVGCICSRSIEQLINCRKTVDKLEFKLCYTPVLLRDTVFILASFLKVIDMAQ